MNKALLLSAMGVLTATGTMARGEEIGRVVSSNPVIRQVQVPRQVCSSEVAAGQPDSVAGARGAGDQPRNRLQCTTQTFLENRTVAYDVQYEYAGREYSAQLPDDPGLTVRLQVTPVAQNAVSSGQWQQGGGAPAGPGYGNGIAPASPGTVQGEPAHPPYGPPQPVYQNPITQTPSYLQSPDGYPPSGAVASSTYYPSSPYYPIYPYSPYDGYAGYPSFGYYPYFPVALSFGFGYWRWSGGHGWSTGHGGGRRAIHGGGGRGGGGPAIHGGGGRGGAGGAARGGGGVRGGGRR